MPTKKELAIELSKLRGFNNPKQELEQYTTPSEIAASIAWNAYMLGDIKEKIVMDLCAGTGILGISALLLGARRVIFIEIDPEAVRVLRENLKTIGMSNYEVLISDARSVNMNADTILMNPPFGTRNRNIDMEILMNASRIARIIYSIHLAATHEYVKMRVRELGLRITHIWNSKLLLKQSMPFHWKNKHYTDINIYRFEKIYKERGI